MTPQLTGKSSLLCAMLNEMNKVHGFVGVHGRTAYVPSSSWMRNTSLRDNILFNKPFETGFYQQVVNACGLNQDFESLLDGDLTQIGERGANLSNEQKTRISLARALYNKADILMLDDPLSALDSVVERAIFDMVIGPNSLSREATRILVTRSQTPLKYADMILG